MRCLRMIQHPGSSIRIAAHPRRYTHLMDPRTIYLVFMVALPAIGVLNAAWFGTELKNFVAATPRLESSRDIEDFKTVVAHQMYAALAQIALLATPPLIYFAGLFTGVLRPADFVFILIPSMVIIMVASVYRRGELRAKNIPAADPELERQRNAIVSTWMRKPWPDW